MDVLLTTLIAVVVVSLVIPLWMRWTLKAPVAPRKTYDCPEHHRCRCSATPLPIAGVGDVDGFGDEYRQGDDQEGPHAA